ETAEGEDDEETKSEIDAREDKERVWVSLYEALEELGGELYEERVHDYDSIRERTWRFVRNIYIRQGGIGWEPFTRRAVMRLRALNPAVWMAETYWPAVDAEKPMGMEDFD
ncbi:hypothetical protein LTR37_020846, partial [Vermiconidia calcicola]